MEDFLQKLDENQLQAVLYNGGPSLVIAGAGSGKTRVLTYKMVYLLQNHFSPSHLLALTFSNKAAREMKSRIAEMVGKSTASRLCMGTFHSIFCKILRNEATLLGFRSNFTIYDTQDTKNLIKTIIKERKLDDRIYNPAFIQALLSKEKNALITPEQYATNHDQIERDIQHKRPYFQEIYCTYRNRCQMANAMDFDDLLLYTYLLFDRNQEILQRYRDQFQFILVDEYQDTNFAQHEIIQQLAIEQQQICVVGDDAQSIYSFRGANIGNILNFRHIYPRSKLFKLEQNYRSTQIIVNAANSLIRKNQERIQKTIYSNKNSGEKIRVISAYSDYEEGYVVANRLSEMRMLYRYNCKDFVILYRTNAQSRIFEEALRKLNIPYRIYGGVSFYQRKEIKDVIAYLRLVSNLTDEEALKRIINYPVRNIGAATMNKLMTAANLHNTTLWGVMSNPSGFQVKINASTQKKLNNFRLLILFFRENISTQNAYGVGRMIVKETGLMGQLYEENTPENISRIQNIEELLNSLNFFVSSRMEEGNPNITIHDFLSEISLLTDQDVDEKEEVDRVTMMTIHASKGLEFKNVFVVGLEENLFPSELSKCHPKKLEEERRLFYVAITRAEENVVLTYAKSRFYNGKIRYGGSISQFIHDIDRKYLSLPSEFRIYNSEKSSLSQQRDSHIDYPQNFNHLEVGNTIRHERFGKGKIIELSGENENTKATVKFEQGIKHLLLKFARFKRIN